MSDKPNSISKFKARIADLHGRFKKRHGVDRSNIKVLKYGNGQHKYTKNEIQQVARQMSNKLGQNYMLEINAKFGPEWESGQLTAGGNDVPIWDPTGEYKPSSSEVMLYNKFKNKIEHFNITILYKGQPLGGFGKHNDCFYDVLVEAFGGKEYLPWKKPSGLKIFVGKDRDSMIAITDIAALENKLNASINVKGDHIYQSTRTNSSRVISMTLINEHFLLERKKEKLVTGISYKERHILFPCGFSSEGETFYGGNGYIKLTFAEITEIKMKPLTAKFIIVRGKYKDVEKEYKEYIEAVEALKKATNGVINFYKTGSVKATAIKLFQDLNVATIQPDPIGQMEAKFINGCPNYGMMYVKEYKGKGYMYDVKTFYGSIQRSNIQLPHKEGEFKKITQEEFDAYKFIPFGIYHCEIIGNHKYFMTSKQNYYTSVDLNAALNYGLEIKLIIDEEPNLLFYAPEKRIQSSVLFRKYIDFLFPLKQQGLELAKDLIVYGWGSLCEGKIAKEYIVNEDKDDVKIMDDDEIFSSFETLKDGLYRVTTIKPDNMFKTNYARIKAFITAKGRRIIADIMMPHQDHIIRAHTDGFISDVKLDIELGNDIGDLVFEGSNKMVFVNGLNDIDFTCEKCGEMYSKNDEKNHLKSHI
jgi:hypothetical protein